MKSKYLDKVIEYEKELLWNRLSALLTNTSEGVHLKLVKPIILETNEDLGLSDLEKLELIEIWQDFYEGIVTFKLKGSNEEFDLSDYPELVEQIYEKLLDRISNI